MEYSTGIDWREWGDAAFAEARAQNKPILLDIGAVWCHWCHVMDTGIDGDPVHTGTYSDPAVQQRIAAHFIPIKVDNDRRPDINARYNMGGWPTTAFLTPGGDTLYGETYVTPTRMVGLLDYIANLWTNNQADIQAQIAEMREQRAASEARTPSDLDPATTETVLNSIRGHFDPEYGGFLSSAPAKFPHPDALRLVLEEYSRTGDASLKEIAEKTLHGMADGGMYDHFAGGFFRYSTDRQWAVPHFEKMLEDNAKLTSVYALAYQVLGDPYYLDVVKSAQGWLLSEMRDPDTGTFAGSQDAGPEEAYYGQPLAVRATLPTPYIDRTVYTGWNALMVSALVARYKITGEVEMLDAALKTHAFLVGDLNAGDDPDLLGLVGGVEEGSLLQYTILYHYLEEGQAEGTAGMLTDQTDFINASLDLYEATGNIYYNLSAFEATEYLLHFLEDKENGGFYDLPETPGAVGELTRRKKDMSENAAAAMALVRLSAMGFSDPPLFRQAAERALKLFADEYAQTGYFAASYARAVEAARAPGLHITIVGFQSDYNTDDLQRAAWSFVAPAKTVETLDADAARKRGLPATVDRKAYATVCVGTVCFAPTADVEVMRQQMQGAQRQEGAGSLTA